MLKLVGLTVLLMSCTAAQNSETTPAPQREVSTTPAVPQQAEQQVFPSEEKDFAVPEKKTQTESEDDSLANLSSTENEEQLRGPRGLHKDWMKALRRKPNYAKTAANARLIRARKVAAIRRAQLLKAAAKKRLDAMKAAHAKRIQHMNKIAGIRNRMRLNAVRAKNLSG